ncbi:hypothetical protein FDI40_gp639 [Agrobacterium phage Atu_ph07]|uniref:Uncharacterized protein n=1 Tax=Agrobacterium phage Atu_ph07 TaxID=2024264 RepID=A0A2L0V0T2_9CAUD|nr:hypothetical protein FDI40_gp639 [Agrobacterium phage Atu_ph07]AUZ95398.1 hypothetical protein [Agrobacterium phage Atu_ph07]
MFGLKDFMNRMTRTMEILTGNISSIKARNEYLFNDSVKLHNKLDSIIARLNIRESVPEPVENVDGFEFLTKSLTMSANENNWFEIVRKRDGVFLKSRGYSTEEEAIEVARQVAAAYPSERFYIIGPLKEVRANIPTTTNDYK